MNKYILLVLFLLGGETAAHRVGGIYRLDAGTRGGFNVWIIDGDEVRRDIYPAYLYGGNPQRYPFIPRNEIWIDNAIAAEEFEYTVAHELLERSLMARQGMSYDDAHNRALELERTMRRADDSVSHAHEQKLPRVSPTDCDGIKEIAELPDSIVLHNIYRVPLGSRGGISIWIVDGAAVRRDIYPDFGLSDNDLACHFIPSKEIWIDGQISCEETEFSIKTELFERGLMAKGIPYDDAYEQAITAIGLLRKSAA
ncbi:MAG: hypothetical protein WBZ48_01585, partial [Bacteroidota bacterium]